MSNQDIYSALRTSGMTHEGAMGVMGNLQAESGCEACRLQGDYELSRARSKEYAAKVDSGEISRHVFSRDGMGWGLYQLTFWSRKEGFYDFCKARGESIASENAQLAYMCKELREQYFSLLKFLCSTNEMYTATKRFCEEFERPAINNVQARYSMAQSIEKELAKEPTPNESATYWPPRVVDKNMTGVDIMVLQSVLAARGMYKGDITGRFNDQVESAVKNFQKSRGLVVDGVVGPMTWAELVKLG